MTVVVWQRTKFGSVAHCRPGRPANTTTNCARYQGALMAPAPDDLPRCEDCNQWAAGTVYTHWGWAKPDVVTDGRLLAIHAIASLQTQVPDGLLIDPNAVRYWTYDQPPMLPAECSLFQRGWRQVRATIHVPREAM